MKTWPHLPLAILWLLLPMIAAAFGQKPEPYVQLGPNYVTSLAFSPDSRLLVSGNLDGVRLYDTSSGREVRSLQFYYVKSVAFSPNGKLIAAAGNSFASSTGRSSYSINLWNVADGSFFRTLIGKSLDTGSNVEIRSVAFSPTGNLLAAACVDNAIRIWDITHDSEPQIIRTPSVNLSLAFSPGGKALAVASSDHKIRFWNLETSAAALTLSGHTSNISVVVFSRDGRLLASGGYDRTIRIWDAMSGTPVQTISGKDQVYSLSFDIDGKILASASGYNLRLCDANTGSELGAPGKFLSRVSVVAYSPDGKMLAGASDDQRIVIFDSKTGQQQVSFTRRSESITSVSLAYGGKALAASSAVSTNVWDYEAGEFRATVQGSISTTFGLGGIVSQDYKMGAAGDAAGNISLWDVENNKQLVTLSGHKFFVSALAIGNGNKLLASGDAQGVIKLWDVGSSKDFLTIDTSPPEKKMILPGMVIDDPSAPGGKRKVGPDLVLTDPSTMFKSIVTQLAFSPDGKTLAGVSNNGSAADMITLWDVKSGRSIRTLPGHADFISALAFDDSGERLASADDKGAIKLWDVASGRELFQLQAHEGRVSSVLFAPRNILISGGADGKVKLWDVTLRKELASLITLDSSEWLVVTPDGLFDGSPAAWSQVLWRSSQGMLDVAPIEIFFGEYFYPNLLPDILSGKRPVAETDIKKRDRRQPTVSLAVTQARFGSDAVSDRTITVRVELEEAPKDKDHTSGSGARDLRLFRNGSLVKVWRGDVLKSSSKTVLEATVSVVAGENRLTAYAFNGDNIKSADAALVVKGAQSLGREGTAYVIAIGVNQYQNREFDLKYAVPDARSFGEEFRRAQDALGKFAKTEVITLINSDATKANLLRALGRLAGKNTSPLTGGDPLETIKPTQPEDAVVIYFSGHGTAEQNRFYLIPHDLGYAGARYDLGKDEKAMKSLLDHSVSDLEMEQAFEKVDAAQLLLVIDACHSGKALESDEKRRGPMNSRGLAQLAYEKGMYILTASQSYQVAIGSKKLGHGYLTYALVEEGLKTGKADLSPADGQVLIREWLDYATHRVPNMQEDQPKEIRDLVQPEAPSNKKGDRVRQEGQTEVQRPRVFYRREVEPQPMIIAKP